MADQSIEESNPPDERGEKFSPELRERLLLWCGRHCCLCGKSCGLFIEIHHIVPRYKGGGSDADNALPVCFDCHGKLSHYDDRQPKGTKYRADELKERREQIYEENTRRLVPALEYKVDSELARVIKKRPDGETIMEVSLRKLPDVGFRIKHPGGTPSVKVTVKLDSYVDGQLTATKADSLYRGEQRWNLNPGEGVGGHFEAPPNAATARDLRVVINLTIFDAYERPHPLLPVTWVFQPLNPPAAGLGTWWLDPVGPDVISERITERFRPDRTVK